VPSGRPPKPTRLEIIQGFPGKRGIRNKREPKPPLVKTDEPPAHLAEQAQHWWKYYVNMLRSLRVLTEADLMALENLAMATADRIEHETSLAKTGPLYKTGTGYVMVSPLFSVVNKLKKRELELLREFGMTPSSRTRVQTTAAPEESNRFARIG
jgi:P27 family predicted phage terminase small subunit